jgi:hypothetical protein
MNKTKFTNYYAMVTDTLYPVPANDTSVFVLKFPRSPFHWEFWLEVFYEMDGDSTDFGMIEISPDKGNHWVNILTEDTLYQMTYFSWNPKPTLKGSTNGYKSLLVRMDNWEEATSGYPVLWSDSVDTALIRFTYITDSGSAPHDGWSIGEIEIYDWHEGIDEPCNCVLLSLSPNPVSDVLYVTRTPAKHEEIEVVNMMGEVVIREHNFTGETVDVRGLAKGVYLLRYSSDKGVRMERFEHL